MNLCTAPSQPSDHIVGVYHHRAVLLDCFRSFFKPSHCSWKCLAFHSRLSLLRNCFKAKGFWDELSMHFALDCVWPCGAPLWARRRFCTPSALCRRSFSMQLTGYTILSAKLPSSSPSYRDSATDMVKVNQTFLPSAQDRNADDLASRMTRCSLNAPPSDKPVWASGSSPAILSTTCDVKYCQRRFFHLRRNCCKR